MEFFKTVFNFINNGVTVWRSAIRGGYEESEAIKELRRELEDRSARAELLSDRKKVYRDINRAFRQIQRARIKELFKN